jgi:hypothetical protein
MLYMPGQASGSQVVPTNRLSDETGRHTVIKWFQGNQLSRNLNCGTVHLSVFAKRQGIHGICKQVRQRTEQHSQLLCTKNTAQDASNTSFCLAPEAQSSEQDENCHDETGNIITLERRSSREQTCILLLWWDTRCPTHKAPYHHTAKNSRWVHTPPAAAGHSQHTVSWHTSTKPCCQRSDRTSAASAHSN